MRPLRNPKVQAAIAWLYRSYMRFCFATIRWRIEARAPVEAIWAERQPSILCFWHARISLSPICWPQPQAPKLNALISLSADGEFIARAVEGLGFPSIRGSSSKKSALDKAKGGSQAFRDMLRALKDGTSLAVTPDGPRGPAEVFQDGAVLAAQRSGAPLLMCGLSCQPRLHLKTWDKGLVPLPFGKGAVVWDGPIYIGRDEDAAAWSKTLDQRLAAVTARADQLVAE